MKIRRLILLVNVSGAFQSFDFQIFSREAS